MAFPGGSADKLGNRYEGLWTVLALLRVLEEAAAAVELERPGLEGEGVEFVLETPTGREYHQVKRTDRGGWTLDRLARQGVLTAFARHLENPNAHCVFVSTGPADGLHVLAERARGATSADEFQVLFAAGEVVGRDFETLRSKWGSLPVDIAWDRLRRIRVETITEHTLKEMLEARLAARVEGEATAVRLQLGEYALERLHQRVTAHEIWSYLRHYGFERREWHNDPTVIGRVEAVTDRFLTLAADNDIRGLTIERAAAADAAGLLRAVSGKRCVLLSGEAGVGKSGVLTQAVKAIRALGWPVLAFRADRLEPVLAPAGVGAQLDLPESPAVVLAAVAAGHDALLVVDQLDAVSFTSGRHPEFFDCLLSLVRQAIERPNLRVLLACRKFDLANDERFRALVGEGGPATELAVDRLGEEEVKHAVQALGLEVSDFSATQLTLLEVPLHLKLLAGSLEEGEGRAPAFGTVNDLYEWFWGAKQRNVRLRLGRSPRWTEIVDPMCEHMSVRQSLSAPAAVVDHVKEDADAMCSEGVLVRDGARVAFFHEGFFDYAFARRFAATGQDLIGLLAQSEQHLFRRAQVRQILQQERGADSERYLQDLEAMLLSGRVRPHLRAVVFALLAAVPDPTEAEWGIIERVVDAGDRWGTDEAWALPRQSGAWFSLLDRLGIVERWLLSGDDSTRDTALWILQSAKAHSPARVAELLEPFVGPGGDWGRRLAFVLRFGELDGDRGYFEFFLRVLLSGALDGEDFWMTLGDLPAKRPEWACEAVARYIEHWLDLATEAGHRSPSERLRAVRFPDEYHGDGLPACARGAPEAFVRELLPVIVLVARRAAHPKDGAFAEDAIWHYRHYHDPHPDFADALLESLITALTAISGSNPKMFLSSVAWFGEQQLEAAQFVAMRALAAAGPAFATVAIKFLAENPERFGIGYISDHERASYELLRAATPNCSPAALEAVEQALLAYYPKWELTPDGGSRRGWAQLKLLEGIDPARRSSTAASRLAELHRKFPGARPVEPPVIRGGSVVSPIRDDAAARMSDEHWLRAMAKHSTDDSREFHDGYVTGGAHQLASVLEERTKIEPSRFAALILRMPDELHTAYFEAVLRGLADAGLDTDVVLAAVHRCHALPGRPCARWITRPVARLAAGALPIETLDLVAWYATEHPDPPAEPGRGAVHSESFDPERDVLIEGINSVRGSAAESMAQLIFEDAGRTELLEPALRRLVADPSIAVRACAAEALTAVLLHDRDLAVDLFLELCDARVVLLAAQPVERFLMYACTTHFGRLAPVVERMLASSEQAVARVGARRACVAAFDEPAASLLAERCLAGPVALRLGAADVYAANLGNAGVADTCEAGLRRLFHDDSEEARKTAASCFLRIPDERLAQLADFVEAFATSPAFFESHPLLIALERSTARLPRTTLFVAERVMDVLEQSDGENRQRRYGDVRTASALVLRVYSQSRDATVLRQCLDLIDRLAAQRVFELERLLAFHDR